MTPGFTGLLPDASRGLLTSNIGRNNQSYGVGEVQHTLSARKVLELNVFILFVL